MTRKVCAWGVLTLFASAGTALAAPEFVHLGVTDMGDGTFQHDYALTNFGGTVPLYDVDTDFVYRYGWIYVKGPDQWTTLHGPMSRWSTESAPCAVDQELLGFTITAGTPTVTASPVYFTDVNHQVVDQGMAMWPETPGPAFVYLGADDMGDGTFEHNYMLTNHGGAVPLFDVDTDFVYRYGWIYVKGPEQWTTLHGPMSRWSTETAPCNVEQELLGFTITAGTPTVMGGPVYFTDVDHEITEQSVAMWPETPGPAFVHLETTDMGDGTFEHDYILANYGGAVPIFDVDTDSLYRYGWISFKSPTDWIFVHGPMSRWSTETAECNVEQELLGFTITAGTPTLYAGAVYFTDAGHEVVYQGQTMWPESDFMIPAVSDWGLAVLALVLLAAGTIVVTRRRAAVE